jgi:hypothetical protein
MRAFHGTHLIDVPITGVHLVAYISRTCPS